MSRPDLTHVDHDGRATMVNIAGKPPTLRRAVAEAFVRCSDILIRKIRDNTLAKGNLIEVARLAGIQAAKQTDRLIPLCHAIPLDHADVKITITDRGLSIRTEASATWKTGVEMEALTAAAVAALTVIDMGKAVDKTMVIEGVCLIEKTGGKSGDYRADGVKTR